MIYVCVMIDLGCHDNLYRDFKDRFFDKFEAGVKGTSPICQRVCRRRDEHAGGQDEMERAKKRRAHKYVDSRENAACSRRVAC